MSMSWSLPPGVRLRALDVTSDAELGAAFSVASACELAAIGWTDETPESIRATLLGPQGLRAGHRLAVEGTEPVGLLEVELDRHARELFLDAYAVGPDGSAIERALLEDGLRTALDIASSEPAPPLSSDADPYQLSPDIWQVTSVREASWNTMALVAPASPAKAADSTKAISLNRSTA